MPFLTLELFTPGQGAFKFNNKASSSASSAVIVEDEEDPIKLIVLTQLAAQEDYLGTSWPHSFSISQFSVHCPSMGGCGGEGSRLSATVRNAPLGNLPKNMILSGKT